MKRNFRSERKGISLIVLVITIIVIIVLAGTIILSLANNNPISQANKATFLSDLKNFETELSFYETQQFADKLGIYDPTKLQADETSVTYDNVELDDKTMNDIITSLGKATKYAGQFVVVDGKLVYQGSDANRQSWSTDAGIQVIVLGEPKVSIIAPAQTVVKQGTNIIYTIKFTSNAALTTVDLTGKVEILDNNNIALATQPNITIGTVSGTNLDSTRQVDITIATNDLVNGAYKLKIRSGSVTNADGKSNSQDTISLVGFDIDNTPPTNPVMLANPSTWTNENVEVTINYSSDSFINEYSLDSTNWNNYTSPVVVTNNGTTIYSRGKDRAGNESGVSTLTVANIDRDLPVVSYGTNGAIDVQTASTIVTVNDVGESDINASTLQYVWDTQNTNVPTNGWSTFTNGENITKSNITEVYYLWIKVCDNAGNSIVSKTNSFQPDNIPPENPVIVATPSTWTKGNVTVTITYSADSAIKQYSLDGISWSDYTSSIVVTENNITIYAKGKDLAGNESGQSTLTVANIDKISPTVSYGTNGDIGESVSTTVTVNDVGGSDIKTSTLKYVWDTQNITTPSTGWLGFTNGGIVTKTSGNGVYYLWIKASDNAGNNVVSVTNQFTLIPTVAVNKPVLNSGMTAVKWNGSSWDTVSNPDTDTSWYNYAIRQWANARTADGSMWVWIPRYEYKIPTPHSSTAQTILINFLSNTSTTPTSGYRVHPAFTFGSVELTGIWIAKFEASGSISAVDIKPGVASLRSITLDAAFTACRNMETTYGTRYGWGTSGIGIDTHLIKNIEWGAAAYLSQSIYGKNSEVWINSSIYTGKSGESVSAAFNGTTYAYSDQTYGVNASTTGNIYGIYDMSGGYWEYTAAYLDNGKASGTVFKNAPSQYKDYYTTDVDIATDAYLSTATKVGDAVYETSNSKSDGTNVAPWYGDQGSIPYYSSPCFIRGGMANGGTSAGEFAFAGANGSGDVNTGFRPVIAISPSL